MNIKFIGYSVLIILEMLSITKNLLMSSIIFFMSHSCKQNLLKKYDGLYQQFDSTYVEYSWPKFPVIF